MQKLLIPLVAIAALAIGLTAYLTLRDNHEVQALVYEPPRALAEFELTGSNGESTANDALTGQWTLLFTGYTFCPDICPTTMAQLRDALPALQEATDMPVRVWLISVDPQRDTVQRISDYTKFFGDEFFGVRAEHKNLYPFVRDLGLMYSIPDEGEDDYLVNHSAAIILVNPDGQRHAIFNAEHTLGQVPTVNMDTLTADFAALADRY